MCRLLSELLPKMSQVIGCVNITGHRHYSASAPYLIDAMLAAGACAMACLDRFGSKPSGEAKKGRNEPLHRLLLTRTLGLLLNQRCDQAGPPGLMAGPYALARVAIKVFVKGQVVAPEWIGLKA